MTTSIIALTAAYAVIAVLLLSLNLTSRWAWQVKAAAIGVTTAFFAATYLAIGGLLGWPSSQRMPPHFQLLWARVVEPDKLRGQDGAIYLWVEQLDENNVPSELPRAYRLPYSDELADLIAGAQEKREEGVDLAGTVEYGEEVDDPSRARLDELEEGGEETSRMDTVPFLDQAMRMSFQDLPPALLPPKPPL